MKSSEGVEFASNHFVIYCDRPLMVSSDNAVTKKQLIFELAPFLQKISFHEQIEYQFKNEELLLQALTHSSFSHEFIPSHFSLDSNERLEFLGDSILNCIVSLRLFKNYSEDSEGDLSIRRAQKVSRNYLAQVARYLKLDQLILLGKGDLKQNSLKSDKVLSSALEAILGALFLDSSFEECQRVFLSILSKGEREGHFLALDHLSEIEKDPKSTLQELMRQKNISVEYKVFNEAIGDLKNEFEVALLIDGTEVIRGKGNSKKKLQKYLAKETLDKKLYQRNLKCF